MPLGQSLHMHYHSLHLRVLIFHRNHPRLSTIVYPQSIPFQAHEKHVVITAALRPRLRFLFCHAGSYLNCLWPLTTCFWWTCRLRSRVLPSLLSLHTIIKLFILHLRTVCDSWRTIHNQNVSHCDKLCAMGLLFSSTHTNTML